MNKAKLASRLLSTAALIASADVAAAQTSTAPSSTTVAAADVVADDIVVTANKREERLRDVPLSISAIAGELLERRQIVDLQDISNFVPGFSFQRGQTGNTPGGSPSQRLILRGLNTGGNGATVASVVDDAPLSFSSTVSDGADFATDFNPYDLQRVEVLKGPQGTLYGAASEGGLVKYVTNAPDPDQWAGGIDAGVLNLRHGDTGGSVKGFVNAPIAAGTAAIRASGYYENEPGWISNNLGGQSASNGFRRFGGRASLLVKPTEAFTARATAYYQDLKSDGYDVVEVNGVAVPTNQFALTKGYDFDTFRPQPNRTKSELYSLNLDYDLGRVRVQSITSYGTIHTDYQFDNTLYGFLSVPFFGRPNTTLISTSVANLKKFNQEFRIASDNDVAKTGHGLEWQAGVFYTHESSAIGNRYFTRDITTGADVTTPGLDPTTAQVFLGLTTARYSEIAGYVSLDYHFSPVFDIEAGGRVFHNDQKFVQGQGGALFNPPAFVSLPEVSSSETRGTFSVAPRFHLGKDAIVYARVASGYRPGGPNPVTPVAGTPTSFTSDSTISYEAGVKAALFERMLSVDVAAFYTDWTDVQVGVTVPFQNTAYPITVNGGKARSQGFEWTFNLTPMRGLNFGWLGAYTDATLRTNVVGINGFSGDRLPYVPQWTTTVTADYETSLTEKVKATVGASYSYTGDRFASFNLRPTLSHLAIPSYSTVAGQLGLKYDRYGIELYGKNLTDERGVTSYYGGRKVRGVLIPGQAGLIRPRELGLRVTANF